MSYKHGRPLVAIIGQQRAQPENEDKLLGRALDRLGARVALVGWDDEDVHWSVFGAAVIRSCWNYHHHYDRFAEWLGRLEEAGPFIVNPSAAIRWNLDKSYLRVLGGTLPVVPTIVVERSDTRPLQAHLSAAGWSDAVIKPTISASADRTYRVSPSFGDEDERRFECCKARGAALIQPYMPEIVDGEASLIFIGGEFSNAVLKIPKHGDFRVQAEFGGSLTPLKPSADQLALAFDALRLVPGKPIIARVDMVNTASGPVLMELELVEPRLFFEQAPHAADRLAAAILEPFQTKRVEGREEFV